jgi:endo-1,4-beta-mannosidase
MDTVRIFLRWEDVQPTMARVAPAAISRVVDAADAAEAAGVELVVTLFTGHMSGVNWIPKWALGGDAGDSRFRVVSDGRVVEERLRNWYTDPLVTRAQARLAEEAARAVRAHPALFAWDLGNESSNCVIPPTREHGREWLARMTDAIRSADDQALVTIGLHMEDLEQDRKLGPAEAAEACDFLTMHGYPGYASWARGPTDEQLLPFLALVTRWLGNGAEVLFSELGVPTYPKGSEPSSPLLVEEHEAAAYLERALGALHASGCSGAMLWCHSDYSQDLWASPPFELAIHERFFGLWHADARPKPALACIDGFRRERVSASDLSWLDIERDAFYRDAPGNLVRMYGKYCVSRA